MLPTRIEVGRQDSTNRQFRTLQSIHEGYGRGLGTALSAFLHSEIQVSLRELSIHTSGGFQRGLPSPTCLMVFRLHPRQERMFLHLDCGTVFPLLELLLGGKGDSPEVPPRNLTEIEWSLLEEIVRVMVRPLGEAWQVFLPAWSSKWNRFGDQVSRACCPWSTPDNLWSSWLSIFDSANKRADLKSPCLKSSSTRRPRCTNRNRLLRTL